MRTTVILDDRLAQEAKQRAAQDNISLSELLNQALRAWLSRSTEPAPPFEMTTFGEGGPMVHHEPAAFAEALDEDDRSSMER